jgi:hypothetical protein
VLKRRSEEHDVEVSTKGLTYDLSNRIDGVTLSGQPAEDFDFSPSGRLTARSKFGSYEYEPERPHALAQVGDNHFQYDARGRQEVRRGPEIPGGRQTIHYNALNQPEVTV